MIAKRGGRHVDVGSIDFQTSVNLLDVLRRVREFSGYKLNESQSFSSSVSVRIVVDCARNIMSNTNVSHYPSLFDGKGFVLFFSDDTERASPLAVIRTCVFACCILLRREAPFAR